MPPSDLLAAFRLDNRLIVVTGASDGLGRTFAEAYAALGARVVLAARRRDRLEAVQRAIANAGGCAEIAVTDLYRLEDIRALAAMVERLAAADDKLVLLNNAGLGFTKAALEVTEAEWDALIDLHLKGTFFCSQQIGTLMLARGYGKIINLSSTWAVATDAGKSPYAAAKAGIRQLTAALSCEWAPQGVRVNALAPGSTLTDFVKKNFAAHPERVDRVKSRIKLGRFAEPNDMVGAAIFLASAASDFVTGQTLFVDGGFTT
jgi:NAD(P)-dependent dehydrogenase (short-subunit alcohol dehydrogenase family)